MPRANHHKQAPGRRPEKPLSSEHFELGAEVERRIARLKVTARSVAAAAGIQESSFFFQRRGRQDVTFSQLVGIARALGTSPARILLAVERRLSRN